MLAKTEDNVQEGDVHSRNRLSDALLGYLQLVAR